jgi:hypothetical protein
MEEIEAIKVRHMEIGDHGVKMTPVEFPPGPQSIRDRHHYTTVRFQLLEEETAHRLLVIDD